MTELDKIIPDGEPRARMIERLAAVKIRLRKRGGADPSAAAAEIILKVIGRNSIAGNDK